MAFVSTATNVSEGFIDSYTDDAQFREGKGVSEAISTWTYGACMEDCTVHTLHIERLPMCGSYFSTIVFYDAMF